MKFYEGIEEELKVLKLETETVRAELEAERLKSSAKAAQTSRIEAEQTAFVSALKAQITSSSSEISDLKAQLSLVHSHQTALESASRDREGTLKALQTALDEERKSKRDLELLYAELWDSHQTCWKGKEWEDRLQAVERAADKQPLLPIEQTEKRQGKGKCKRTPK